MPEESTRHLHQPPEGANITKEGQSRVVKLTKACVEHLGLWYIVKTQQLDNNGHLHGSVIWGINQKPTTRIGDNLHLEDRFFNLNTPSLLTGNVIPYCGYKRYRPREVIGPQR